jgi:hypothetical protein
MSLTLVRRQLTVNPERRSEFILRCTILLSTCLVATGAPCGSQTPLMRHELDSGRVVRLHLLSGPPEAGRLIAPFAPDSVTVRYCLYYASPCQSVTDATWRQRLTSDIARLEIKVGSRAARGFLIGSAACGIVWALVSPLAGWPDWTENPAYLLVDFVGGAIVSAPVCGGTGALIGAQQPVWGPPPD